MRLNLTQCLEVVESHVALSDGLFNFGSKMLYDDHAHLFKTRPMAEYCISPCVTIGGGGIRGDDSVVHHCGTHLALPHLPQHRRT